MTEGSTASSIGSLRWILQPLKLTSSAYAKPELGSGCWNLKSLGPGEMKDQARYYVRDYVGALDRFLVV